MGMGRLTGRMAQSARALLETAEPSVFEKEKV